jgi:hypothetical protein
MRSAHCHSLRGGSIRLPATYNKVNDMAPGKTAFWIVAPAIVAVWALLNGMGVAPDLATVLSHVWSLV